MGPKVKATTGICMWRGTEVLDALGLNYSGLKIVIIIFTDRFH